mmetsp:Transcript_46847/g.109390  ORF Transcript_46847/g.109390 Transcript_46847/m.109390 type:complete len:231 (+) Transcript_46847:1541-2233(+)
MFVHRAEVAKQDGILAHIPGVVPTGEGGDDGVEEDASPRSFVHAQGRQGRRRYFQVAPRQPFPRGALLGHHLLRFFSRFDRVGLRPGAPLGRCGVCDLWHGANVAHPFGFYLPSKVGEVAHEEVGHLIRRDDGCRPSMLGLNFAAKKYVVGWCRRLRQLVVEGDRLVRRGLVGCEDYAFHDLCTRRRTTNVVVAFTAHCPHHQTEVLRTGDAAVPKKHRAMLEQQVLELP